MRDIINELVCALQAGPGRLKALSATIAVSSWAQERNIKAQIDFLLPHKDSQHAASFSLSSSFSFSFSSSINCSCTLLQLLCAVCIRLQMPKNSTCATWMMCTLHPISPSRRREREERGGWWLEGAATWAVQRWLLWFKLSVLLPALIFTSAAMKSAIHSPLIKNLCSFYLPLVVVVLDLALFIVAGGCCCQWMMRQGKCVNYELHVIGGIPCESDC